MPSPTTPRLTRSERAFCAVRLPAPPRLPRELAEARTADVHEEWLVVAARMAADAAPPVSGRRDVGSDAPTVRPAARKAAG